MRETAAGASKLRSVEGALRASTAPVLVTLWFFFRLTLR
jgi:hypothetical protein